jgi:hypothetical protein
MMSTTVDHSEWLDSTLTTMNQMKLHTKSSSKVRSWNQRVVTGERRSLYDSTKDRYCPLRYKKEARRQRQMSMVIDMTSRKTKGAQTSSQISKRLRPKTASASSSLHRSRSSSSTLTPLPSSVQHSRSHSHSHSHSQSVRPSTAGASSTLRRSRRRVRKRPARTGGITYQQSAGNSGAHDDLRVVYQIMSRENLLLRIKKNATQYMTHHRWEAVSVGSSVSSLGSASKPPPGMASSPGGSLTKGAALIETIRQDLDEIRRISLKVVHFVWLWRQDQMLTLHERQNPTDYPPRPFVYNGHDYLLKMIQDLNYLKDLQPITLWLGAPLLRNPFALMSDDPNCIDNLDMQFDGSLSDLASCAHLSPPPSIVLDLENSDPMCIKWSSLCLLAQEAIYGRGPEGSSLMTGNPTTTTANGGGSSSTMISTMFQLGGSQNLQVTRSLLSENGSVVRDGGGHVFKTSNALPSTSEAMSIEESKAERESLQESKLNEREISQRSPHSPHSPHSRNSPALSTSGLRTKVQSKVKSVISQNAVLRNELQRLRSQLEIERETLYQLERAEKKTII